MTGWRSVHRGVMLIRSKPIKVSAVQLSGFRRIANPGVLLLSLLLFTPGRFARPFSLRGQPSRWPVAGLREASRCISAASPCA